MFAPSHERPTTSIYVRERPSDWYDRSGHALGYLSGPEHRDLHLYYAVTKA